MNFFDGIISYIELAWEFFLNTLHSISTSLNLLRNSLTHIVDIIGFYPAILSASAIIVIGIIVVKFVIGR